VTAEEHRAIAEDFSSFIAGQTSQHIRRLEREMKAASDATEYEKAARIRDDIGALRKAMEQNAVVLADGTDADVIAVAEDPLEIAVQVFYVRGGRVRGQRGWVADRVDDAELPELIGRFLIQVYDGEESDAIPREVLVPEPPADDDILTTWLSDKRGSRVSLRVPRRGDKRTLMETVARNASQSLALHKTKRASDFTTRSRALEELQEALDLPEAPLRIECYDVSNLQGTEVVASMVVFEDGLPRKSDYRRFVIRGFEGQNDVAAMHETITRRFRRLLDERAEHTGLDLGETPEERGPALIDPDTGRPRKFAYTPGLVVVDGGPPQVAAAQRALDELGIDDVPVVGLAKRLEEVWRPSTGDPVILPRTSEGLYLLQRVRDEAHRFAITHHRNRRSKSMVESLLDEVPGLGEVRRKVLLRHFGSLKKLRAASIDDIAALPGFGQRTAESIAGALVTSQGQGTPAVNTATGEIIDDAEVEPEVKESR
jgi:excinuclease ABC subunit C